MNKKTFFLISILIGLLLPLIVSAQFTPLVQCGTKDSGRECTLCDIFILLQRILNFIWWALLIIAPLFIIAGGIMILTAGIKPDQVEAGKRIITGTIVALIIAFLSWAVLNMIFNALANQGSEAFPWPWNEIHCVGGGTTEQKPCTKDADCSQGMYCDWFDTYKCVTPENLKCYFDDQCPYPYYCGDDYKCTKTSVSVAGWCSRPDPYDSLNWRLSSYIQYPKQKGDASQRLADLLRCMFMYMPDPNLAITAISSNTLCANPSCDTSTGNCGHVANSCHFGGTSATCKGYSYAVDFNLSNIMGVNPATLCKAIATQAKSCDSSAWINYEGNHVHVSVNNSACGCAESGSGTPCPN